MESYITIFLALVFAHLLADYPLQGEFLAKMKGKNLILLISHAGIWTGCISVMGYFMGLNVELNDIIVLFVVHAVADYLKATGKLWYKNMDSLRGGLLSDQMIHAGQILLLMFMTVS